MSDGEIRLGTVRNESFTDSLLWRLSRRWPALQFRLDGYCVVAVGPVDSLTIDNMREYIKGYLDATDKR